jgi:hypothetical protein
MQIRSTLGDSHGSIRERACIRQKTAAAYCEQDGLGLSAALAARELGAMGLL